MKKNRKSKEKRRNIVRILLILLFSFLVSFILCHNETKANNKIIEQTVNDAFVFQSILLAHNLEPNTPKEYTDISSLDDTSDTESFVSDAAIKTGVSQYYIRVNYSANCITIFTKDDEGNYTKPYKAMICSSGKSTPKSGTYKITYKYRWLSLYGGVYGQYSTRIVKNILFHSVPYYKQRADTLEYEEYDKLGTTASAGCIRLTVRDAKWIYDNITSGTYVEFYSDPSNPGPLGKPKAQKISGDIDNRNWDPTDPDKNNPWTGGNGVPSVSYTTEYKNNKNTTKKNNTTIESESTTSNSSSTPPASTSSTSSTSTSSQQSSESTSKNLDTNTPKKEDSDSSGNTTNQSTEHHEEQKPSESTPSEPSTSSDETEKKPESEPEKTTPSTPSSNTTSPESSSSSSSSQNPSSSET